MRNLVAVLAMLLLGSLASVTTAQDAPPPLSKYVVVFTSDNWQANQTESQLVRMVTATPQGSPLEPWVSGASVKHVKTGDPVYSRFSALAPADKLPVVVVQRADGGYVYKASAGNIPTDHYALGREIEYYAGLDPLKMNNADGSGSMADSAATHGQIGWLNESDFCPDGRCPTQPRQPLLAPKRPLVQVGPDSVEMTPQFDFSGVSTAIVVVVCVLAFVGACLTLCFLLFAAIVAYRLLSIKK